MGLSLRGATSGAIDINPPAVAGDNTITLPPSNGGANQFFKNSGTAGIVTYSSMVESPTGNIGIGTDPGSRKVEIFGTVATVLQLNSSSTDGTSLRILNSGTPKMFVGLAGDFIAGQGSNVTDSAIRTSGACIFSTGASGLERVRITTDGNVGIGTDNPSRRLQISRDDQNTVLLETADDTSYGRILFDQAGVTNRSKYVIAYNQNSADWGDHLSLKNQTGPISFYAGGLELNDERVRITTDGYVGIGTTTPSATLTVGSITSPSVAHRGAIAIKAEDTSGTGNISVANMYLEEKNGGEGFYLSITDNGDFDFNNSGTVTVLTLNDNNNVGVGTTTPAAKLTVSGNSDNNDEDCQLRIEDNDTSAGSRIPSLAFYASGTETGKIRGADVSGMIFYTNGSERFTLDTSGNASITDGDLSFASGHGISFAATSDGSGTSTSEQFDDYEEGTFTPGVTFGGGQTGMTFGEQVGQYTKIGRYVFCSFVYQFTAKGSTTGECNFTGLPYASMNDSGARGGGGFTYATGFVGLNQIPILYSVNNSTVVYVYQVEQSDGTGTRTTALSHANFTNSSQWRAYLCYYTNS